MYGQGKTAVLGRQLCSIATSSTANSVWTGLRWNPDIHGEWPATNRLDICNLCAWVKARPFLNGICCLSFRGRNLLTTPKVPQSSRPQAKFHTCQSYSRPKSLFERSTIIFINDTLNRFYSAIEVFTGRSWGDSVILRYKAASLSNIRLFWTFRSNLVPSSQRV